jgi:hypothetical protein
MLNCLKEHKVLIIPVVLILVLIIILSFVEIDIVAKVGCFLGVSCFFIFPSLGYLYNNYKFRECIYKNEQDKLAVINNLNKILSDNKYTIDEKKNKIPEITDDGNNIIKLKTLQKHLYNRKTALLIDKNPNTEEIAEVDIYIQTVNPLIARYNLEHPFLYR